MAKQEKRKQSLTSDTDVDTNKKLATDDRICLQRDVEETDSENRSTEESTSNCLFPEQLVTDDSTCLQRDVEETDSENRCTGESTSNCIFPEQLVTDDSTCLQRDVEETDSENRITGESTSNCIFPGTCEVEVSYEGETTLKKHFENCKKNQGHQIFVRVDQFSIEHLPPGYRNTDLLDLIRALSDLTVRVSVKCASDRRPKTCPGSDKPYPFCEEKYRRFTRTGTGIVYQVKEAPSQIECSTCKKYTSRKDNHSIFLIETAAHVVYDEQEALETTCHLFFDKGDKAEQCPGVVAITNLLLCTFRDKTNEDHNGLRYVTCDSNVIDRLKKSLELFKSLKETVKKQLTDNISKKYDDILYSTRYGEKLLRVIVSHPHGCSKRVSVGYCRSRSPFDEKIYLTRLTYNTPTCPGSSGAPVLVLDDLDNWIWHLHSANIDNEGNKEINHSSRRSDDFYSIVFNNLIDTRCSTYEVCRLCSEQLATDDRRCLQRDVEETDSENRCTGESTSNCTFSRICIAGVGYKRHFDNCKKNPGHLNFVPVDQFSIEHLPSAYKNNELLDLIRALSDLTVRVSVKYASDRRPKTWPGTNKPYPFCEEKYRRFTRTGTGIVCQVEEAPSQMKCSTCKNYPSRKDNHSLFVIETAAPVVYDEQEAQHTTCHLFFDKGDTAGQCPSVVAITNLLLGIVPDKGKEDISRMCYVTCDSNVIDRLKKNLELFESLNKTVRERLTDNISKKYDGILYSARYGENPLCIIVSHPHGRSKRVSVGYCSSRSPSDEEIYLTRLTYNTPTCPGSSGAPVLVLDGWDEGTWHLHSGHIDNEGNKEINYSSWRSDDFYSDIFDNLIDTRYSTYEDCRLCSGNNVDVPRYERGFLVNPVYTRRLKLLFVGDEREEPWDVEVSYGGEAEFRQRYDTCEKNQGHILLISIDQLNEDRLQGMFKVNEWLDLIRVLSDLTVRVSVKSVSDKRPDDLKFLKTFSDDEEQPDSCYRDSTRNMMLTGTGCVAKVIKYENSDEYRNCSCKECQMSQTPKTEFAHIYIRTTIQVVYDNFEAEHSTCDFFFDRGHTPDTCPGVITLSGVSVEDCEKEDMQYLICVTHDLGLADRLAEKITKYKSLPKIILEKIKDSKWSDEVCTVVVSHPHGCSKKISIVYTGYGTQTCTGSAGAHFLVLDYDSLFSFVHIGKCEVNRYRSHDGFLKRSGSRGKW